MVKIATPASPNQGEATELTYPPSIAQAFLDSCHRTPQKPCLLFEGATISYEQLFQESLRWAVALRAWGLAPGDRVALFLDNSPDYIAAYLGTHLARSIVVLVNTQYRQVELRHILSDAGVRLCVTDPPRLTELERVRADLPALERVVVVGADERVFLAAPDRGAGEGSVSLTKPRPYEVALIAYTSGTTGRSKGAMLTHRNLVANSAAVTTAWRWTAADRLLLALPLFHVHGLCVGIHGTLLTGGTADLRRRFDASEAYETLLQGETTMFFGVPTMYTRLIAEAQQRLADSGRQTANSVRRPPPIRLYVSGSAPLSVQTFEEFDRQFGQRILERYGMTETIMNLTNPYDGERRPGTVGMPFPGQEARIVDVRTRQPTPDGTLGEIQVRGPHVFQGYWQRPDAAAEAFDQEGWFNTGDLGWRSADGYNTISGRAKELIITGGYNVYPREVEEVLLTHPGVAEAAVFGLPDPEFGEQVAAAIVVRPEIGPVNADEVVNFCRDQLASYKKPRQVFYVESLPRNALGKIQKHLLQQQFTAR